MVLASICGSSASAGYLKGSSWKGPAAAGAAVCAKAMREETAAAAIPVAAIIMWRRDIKGIVDSPFRKVASKCSCVLVRVGDSSDFGSGVECHDVAIAPQTSG